MEFDYWIILYIIDLLIFLPVAFTVIYMAVFSFASTFYKRSEIPVAKRQNRFIVLVPSYKKDSTIENTVKSILGQTYPQRLFDVVVISDHQDEITNFRLAQYPITLLTPNFDQSTKAKSLQYAINNLPQFKIFDVVVVLDADNMVLPEFLEQMNDAYEHTGVKAVQAHRMSRNRDTATAVLDATFEEINNTIFRLGHVTVGLPATIVGSGMAFEYSWFKDNINKIKDAWDDKELDSILVRQHIYVDYQKDIFVFDEKMRTARDLTKQRGRWASAQFHTIVSNIHYLPSAIVNKEYDLIDKILQWMLLPRTMMMGIIAIMSIIIPFVYFSLAIKWWVTLAFIMFVFAMATPDYLIDKNWDKAFFKAPFIMLFSILNIFRIGRRKKKFINDNTK